MNSSIIKIKIAGLPAIFPAADFVGRWNTYDRVILIGNHSEVVETDEAFRTIYDNNYQTRKVQSVTYDKYLLRIPANEYWRIDLIEHAKFITITTHDEIEHNAIVLNVNYTKEEGTELGVYEIEYADKNPQNYKNQSLPINNFLEHNNLQNEYELDQLVRLTMHNSETIDSEFTELTTVPIGGDPNLYYYSELLPEFVIPEIKEESEEVNGVEKVTRSSGSRAMRARFYLQTDEKNQVAKYLQRCSTVALRFPWGERSATERVVPEIQPVGVNLFQVDIVMKYETTNYYPENI
ncbi:MAG: hypothetical protein RQ760_16520 [Sedimentisphaerales bacterium]|nr:hypothetical protein [Sedimentisphaerales bacterium]